MTDDEETISPDHYLTKTEAFVVACRKRGMSGTAIRRLLQLSASDAAALGIIPAQALEVPTSQGAGIQGPTATSWPQREGRHHPFPRRRRPRAQTLRRPPVGQRKSEAGKKPSQQGRFIRKEPDKNRGENV